MFGAGESWSPGQVRFKSWAPAGSWQPHQVQDGSGQTGLGSRLGRSRQPCCGGEHHATLVLSMETSQSAQA